MTSSQCSEPPCQPHPFGRAKNSTYVCLNHRGPISGAADDTGPSDLRERAEAWLRAHGSDDLEEEFEPDALDLTTLLRDYGDERERQARLDERRKVAAVGDDDAAVVEWFAARMKAKLGVRETTLSDGSPSGRKQLGWRDSTLWKLFKRLLDEEDELRHTIPSEGTFFPESTIDEAVDVANFAMMIADWAAQR